MQMNADYVRDCDKKGPKCILNSVFCNTVKKESIMVKIGVINIFCNNYQWVHFVWQNLVKCIAIITKCNSTIGRYVCNINIFVDIYNKFSFGMYFYENFLFIHSFDNFANIRPLFLLQKEQKIAII